MVANNTHYEKVGLPTITHEEHHSIMCACKDLENHEPLAVMPHTPASCKPKGPNTIYCIHVTPKDLHDHACPPAKEKVKQKEKARKVKENIDYSNGWMEAKAIEELKKRVQSRGIDDSEVAKINYKAKMMHHIAMNTPWTISESIRTIDKRFSVEKNKFHATLVSTFTDGLNLPFEQDVDRTVNVNEMVEDILNNIKNTIKVSSSDPSKNSQNLDFFITLTAYKEDLQSKVVEPHLRTIYFTVSQSLSNFARAKHDTSSGVNVDVQIHYVQSDRVFKNRLFAEFYKEKVVQFLKRTADGLDSHTYDVPV